MYTKPRLSSEEPSGFEEEYDERADSVEAVSWVWSGDVKLRKSEKGKWKKNPPGSIHGDVEFIPLPFWSWRHLLLRSWPARLFGAQTAHLGRPR